jgi:hypothetical protein
LSPFWVDRAAADQVFQEAVVLEVQASQLGREGCQAGQGHGVALEAVVVQQHVLGGLSKKMEYMYQKEEGEASRD